MEGAPRRPTWVEVDLDAVEHNARLLKARVGPNVALMAVVKADGYGHGAVPVAAAAVAGGATWLGVAMPEEGLALREAGIDAPILILGWTPPEQAELAIAYDLTQTVFSAETAEVAAAAARSVGRPARVHVKVDTGMGRLGFRADDPGATAAIQAVAARPELVVEGIYTHFASAEDDVAYTRHQLHDFLRLLERLEVTGCRFRYRHAANSAAIWTLPESHLDLVRSGISLYGYGGPEGSGLRPVLSWLCRISQVKDLPAGSTVSYGRTYRTSGPERVAVLPVGYADGYVRGLSNRGCVLIRGKRVPVRGRVCMDQVVVSVDGVGDVCPGEEVVLVGRRGDGVITAEDLAQWAGTISYEILCGISRRVPRVYLGGRQRPTEAGGGSSWPTSSGSS
ncbi:MAG: alanine racemase [Clostridia bacterium]|nr:alanine racemase [Clostridia bacterium]